MNAFATEPDALKVPEVARLMLPCGVVAPTSYLMALSVSNQLSVMIPVDAAACEKVTTSVMPAMAQDPLELLMVSVNAGGVSPTLLSRPEIGRASCRER